MIMQIEARLSKAGLLERVNARLGTANSLSLEDLQGTVDFIFGDGRGA